MSQSTPPARIGFLRLPNGTTEPTPSFKVLAPFLHQRAPNKAKVNEVATSVLEDLAAELSELGVQSQVNDRKLSVPLPPALTPFGREPIRVEVDAQDDTHWGVCRVHDEGTHHRRASSADFAFSVRYDPTLQLFVLNEKSPTLANKTPAQVLAELIVQCIDGIGKRS